MKVRAAVICNELNHTKIAFDRGKKFSYLAVTNIVWLNQQKDE